MVYNMFLSATGVPHGSIICPLFFAFTVMNWILLVLKFSVLCMQTIPFYLYMVAPKTLLQTNTQNQWVGWQHGSKNRILQVNGSKAVSKFYSLVLAPLAVFISQRNTTEGITIGSVRDDWIIPKAPLASQPGLLEVPESSIQ